MRNRFVKIIVFLLISLLLFFMSSSAFAERKTVRYTAEIWGNQLTITFDDTAPEKGYYKLFWRKTTSSDVQSSVFDAGAKQYTVEVEPGVFYKVSLYYSRAKGALPAKYQ